MRKKRILLVDDEPSFTRIVKLHLEETGVYEVREENRGTRALAAARQFKPDLILLDVVMPDPFLAKPVNADQLIDCIEKNLQTGARTNDRMQG